MQSNISMQLKTKINSISQKKIDILDSYLKFNINSYLSANDIADKVDISFDDAKEIARILVKNNILDMQFTLFCNNEIDVADIPIYESIQDIPQDQCEECEKHCSLIKNIVVIYKVIKDC